MDDPDEDRHIFGFKEPCYKSTFNGWYDDTCTTSVNFGSLVDRTTLPAIPTEPAVGWKISLDPDGSYTFDEGEPPSPVTRDYLSERMVSDPFVTETGCAFFPSFQPYNDTCAIGGKSFVWVVDYETGGLPECDGRLTFQVSSGAIEERSISSMTLRKTAAAEGQTAEGPSVTIQGGSDPVNTTVLKRKH